MKVLIAGGTGMVGGLVLKQCLNSTEINEVVSLVRKPTGQLHQKLSEVVIEDFTDYTTQATSFEGVSAAFFCIGVYTGEVADDVFKKLTVDYAVAFAAAVEKNSPGARFCLLSGAALVSARIYLSRNSPQGTESDVPCFPRAVPSD